MFTLHPHRTANARGCLRPRAERRFKYRRPNMNVSTVNGVDECVKGSAVSHCTTLGHNNSPLFTAYAPLGASGGNYSQPA
jgi:hypothetical protein